MINYNFLIILLLTLCICWFFIFPHVYNLMYKKEGMDNTINQVKIEDAVLKRVNVSCTIKENGKDVKYYLGIIPLTSCIGKDVIDMAPEEIDSNCYDSFAILQPLKNDHSTFTIESIMDKNTMTGRKYALTNLQGTKLSFMIKTNATKHNYVCFGQKTITNDDTFFDIEPTNFGFNIVLKKQTGIFNDNPVYELHYLSTCKELNPSCQPGSKLTCHKPSAKCWTAGNVHRLCFEKNNLSAISFNLELANGQNMITPTEENTQEQ